MVLRWGGAGGPVAGSYPTRLVATARGTRAHIRATPWPKVAAATASRISGRGGREGNTRVAPSTHPCCELPLAPRPSLAHPRPHTAAGPPPPSCENHPRHPHSSAAESFRTAPSREWRARSDLRAAAATAARRVRTAQVGRGRGKESGEGSVLGAHGGDFRTPSHLRTSSLASTAAPISSSANAISALDAMCSGVCPFCRAQERARENG